MEFQQELFGVDHSILTTRKFPKRTAAIGALPPPPDPSLIEDRLEDERTVFNNDRSHRFTR